jgi:hypothetical protein
VNPLAEQPAFAPPFSRGPGKHEAANLPGSVSPPIAVPVIKSNEPELAKPKRKAAKRKLRKKVRRQNNHAAINAAAASSFSYSVERKDRLVYFSSLLNGDNENYFGQVLSAAPVSVTLDATHVTPAADGLARVQVALQGAGFSSHQIEVSFNNVSIGSITFLGLAQHLATLNVPVSLLQNGANTLKFTTVGGGLTIVDYIRLTYPHALLADNNSLRLSLRPTQSVTIGGFSTAKIRVLDCTNPYAVGISNPLAQPFGGAFAININGVSLRAKARELYALPDNQFDTPAFLALNEPSSLNLSTNGADLLVIGHKSLLPSVGPLVSLRQAQSLAVSVVDVEDVFDEFDFGTHGPTAIKNFLSRANSSWSLKPRYVILLGDASNDPRNYEGFGSFDFVPTKLVDATFSETASDDWFSDFNNDGLPEIAMGRLPVRTMAEADLVIAKIVSFTPAAVPQSALLVADDPTGFYFNFESANDDVQALLPGSMTVQKVNKRTDPDARNSVISQFNSGQALVNYSGHGNVDTWTGASIFTSTDASRLTNAVSVVVSQVYGGGGEVGSTFKNDFMELFNRGPWPVTLSGWSVQYAAAGTSVWQVTPLPDAVIQPGKYFLVQQAAGPGGTTNLPAPDATGTIDINATSGKVALVNTTSALAGSGCPLSASVVDLVGYGGAECALGTAAPATTITTATIRAGNGCTHTRMNSADFASGVPTPRSSASATNACAGSSSRLPLSFVVVMDCLNGYFQDRVLLGLGEALLKAPNGGAVAVFASSGSTIPDGPHLMSRQLYLLIYGSQSIPVGDAIKQAKAATDDIDVRRTWIFFGDPSMRIR